MAGKTGEIRGKRSRRHRQAILPALPLLAVTAAPLPAFSQAYTGDQSTNGPFSAGVQWFNGFSTLNASAANAVTGGTQYFWDSSILNASAANAVTGGEQYFYEDSTLNASTANAINGGTQRFYDTVALNASAADAVSGGTQYFSGNNTLNASTANAVNGGIQRFYGTSALNASAAEAVSGGFQYFYYTNVLNALAANAVNGGTQWFYDFSTLNASTTDAVSGGIQTFWNSSALNASAADAVSGGTQTFWNSSVLNASAADAISGGTQTFWNSSMLNASAASAVSDGTQTFSNASTLNASVANAVNGGNQRFYDGSLLNASAANAVSGGIQYFYHTSALNASVADAVSGGTQTFWDFSVLNASAANAVSGGIQAFWNSSALNASAANAVSGGIQAFENTSALNASAEKAVSGGIQIFENSSTLNATATGAVSGGNLTFYDSSVLNVLADNALTDDTPISFNNPTGGTGGTLRLNGYSTVVGSVQSSQPGAGIVENSGAVDSMLTIDGSTVGNSSFSGLIRDGGSGRLGLTLAGGTLTLGGSGIRNTYSGGTFVEAGTLRVLDSLSLGTGSTLGTGAIVMAGGTTLSFGGSPSYTLGPLTLNGDVTIGVDAGQDASLWRSISGAGGFDKTGAGTLTIEGNNSFAGNVHVSAGTLSLDNWTGASNQAIADTARLTVDAGAKVAFNDPETIGELTGAGQVDVTYARDTGLTVGAGDTDFSFAGNITGGDPTSTGFATYGLTKTGSGVFTLSGSSDSQRGVLVSRGTLDVAGSIAASVVDVGNGGTLAGGGHIAGVVQVYGGGTLSGQAGSTLTVGSDLTLAPGSVVSADLGTPNSTALFDVAGDLTLDGTLNVTDAGGFGAGVYRLFDYGGTLTNNGLAIGATPGGVTADDLGLQTATAGQVNLISSAGAYLGFWDGGNASLYDNGVIDGGAGAWRADGRNWTDVDGAVNGPFRPNPTFAVFQGNAGTVTVDASAGALGVAGMQFVTDGYRIEGDPIALEGANGQTVIRVGDGTAAGAATTATIASALTGASSLVKNDLGTLVLTGDNTYAGGTTINGGTLSVSRDANLGTVTGGLTFDGGALATTASFDTARSIALTQAGRFDIATGTELGLTGVVSGKGDLVKLGNGTLRLVSDANSYGGGTTVTAGTLVGNASSIRGDLANAGSVVFDQAGNAGFAGDITGYGGTDGTMTKRNAGTLTLAGTSTLDWSVEAGTLVSASNRFTGDLNIASGAGFAFDQASDGNYAGTISGAGDLATTGGGAVTLGGDSSGFSGLSTVTGSTLIVNSRLGGSALIGMDGRLAGKGTIGSGAGSLVTIADGGTLAPGNSIGTLTVDGNLVMASGSRYEVEVAPGGTKSDLVAVTGTATINGGTVAHIGMTGTYDPTATYTILSAAGGLTAGSAFNNVTSDFAFLDPMLGYGPNSVTLTLARNDVGFADVGVTRNQIATAGGLESLGFGNALYDAVVQLDQATARDAFDQLSGEAHASAKTALIEDSHFLRDAATNRIRAAFDAIGASSAPVMAYADPEATAVIPVAPTTDRFVLWGQGFGGWGHTDSDGNAARLSHSTGGFLVGGDAPVFDTWRLGMMAGYSRTDFDVRDRASSGTSDNYHLGLYGGTQWGNLGFRAGAAYTWHDISTSRSVAFPGFSDSLKGDYRAGTAQVFGELGYGIDAGTFGFEPFANLAYVNLDTDGFAEKGGAAALRSAGTDTGVTFTTLGLHASTDFAFGDTAATLRGTLGWRHAFGDTTPLSTFAFAGGSPFTIAGAPIARDALVLDAGLDFAIARNTTLGVSYGGQFGNSAIDQSVKGNLAIRF